MKSTISITTIMVMLALSVAGIADDTNLAIGKKVSSLPVASYNLEFYEKITDGDLKTFADWRAGWVKEAYLVIDLEQVDYIDEVKVHSSNVDDYFAGWFNLKPHLAVYAGEDLDSLEFLAEKIPSENYEYVSPEDIKQPFVSFSNLNTYGRYVVVYCFRGWGTRLYEIEVLKQDKEHKPYAPSTSTTSLREMWLKNISLSGWLPMTTKVVTPHVKWSNPAAAGPLRTLFFIHKGQFRVIAELNQRMELEWDWVSIFWNSSVDTPAVSPMNIVQEKETHYRITLSYLVIHTINQIMLKIQPFSS